jgi:predicted ATPase/DNA-binding winged helix-turn-helix (wHTH) protein
LIRSHRFDRFELSPAERQLRADGQSVPLGARAFDVLLALVEHRDRVLTKDDLLSMVWPGLVVEEANVQVQISALRKLLGPSVIATIPGRGYRFTARLEQGATASAEPAPAPMAEPAPAAAAPPTAHNLPQPRTHFIGRESALADGARLLASARLLTFTGIGGSGKTRLALQLAQQQVEHFADGVWFVDLAPLQDGQRVAAAVAAALGVREEAGTPVIDRLTTQLVARRLLLVLDNCEQVADSAAEVADSLLTACAGLKIVATSRESLRLTGEQIVPVRPLTLPASSGDTAPQDAEAVQLFVDRARLVLPDFQLDAGNAEAVGDICRRLDGIALAIELAAARVRMLSVAEIRLRLDDRFRFLQSGSRALPRHQTLHAALQWSYDSLSEPEQRLLCELTVFAGSCSLEAVVAVCDVEDAHAAIELLGSLHDKSLLLVEHGSGAGGAPRYRLLETVRQYVQQRFDETGAAWVATRDRHLQHCAVMCEAALEELRGPLQGQWMARLRLEQENLLAAHAWCAHSAVGVASGLRLVGGLAYYWLNSGQLERGYVLAEAVLAQAGEDAEAGEVLWRCRAMHALGMIAFRMGRYEDTLQVSDRCLGLARSLDDTVQLANALSLRGKGLHSSGQLALALACSQESCAVARTLGKSVRLSAALNNLAEVHRSLGNVAEAEAAYVESIALTRELRYAGGCYVALCNLTRLLVNAGRAERARFMLLESWELLLDAGLKGLSKDLLDCTAGLAALRREDATAARFGGAALARLDEAGIQREPVDEAFIAPLIARVKARMGESAFEAAHAGGHALDADASLAEVKQWLDKEPPPASA